MPSTDLTDLVPDLRDAADKLADSIEGFLKKRGAPGWVTFIVAGLVGGLYFSLAIIIKGIVAVILAVASYFAVTVLENISKAKKDNASQFNDVIAAAMGDVLGTDFSADEIPAGKGSGGGAARNAAIGGKLQDLLSQQFGGVRELSPEDGAKNAAAFSGFALNYAISAAFLGILGECESLGFVKNFKDLGEDTAQALGLGRLSRLALQPLIRNMVQQPYDLYLRSKVRPDRLTEAQYIHGLHHGDFDESFVRAKLAEKGYPDAEIDRLILELTAHLAEADILRLIRYGDMTQDEGVAELNVQGIPKVTAERLLRATTLSRADSLVSSYVNKIESQYLNGFIDEATFNKGLDAVPWTEEEKQWERNFVGVTLDAPQTTLTLTQVKAGIVGGILDFNYLDRWMTNQGYSDEDQLYLEYEILQAMDQSLSKQEIASAKAARVAAAVKVAPTITRT